MVENSPYQILCATHSPMMIDISKEHSSLIRAVKQDDETTRTYQVDENIFSKNEDRKNQVQMINRFNPHICEAFYASKVILVEGDTETIVYRDLLKRFYPNDEVFVLNTGSKYNIPFFQEVLTAFRIEHCVIHDMDYEFLKADKNGKVKRNSAWAMNETIWKLVEEANKIQIGLARRYVHNANFENGNDYTLQNGKDKPFAAYRFVRTIRNMNDGHECVKWLKDLMGAKKISHDEKYIEANKKTIEIIETENEQYIKF